MVEPLVQELDLLGLRVWYDRATLRIGDSLRAQIQEGFKNSRLAVVVLSPAFFRKRWPKRELDALTQLDKQLLPIWHKVSADDVLDYSSLLSDLVAASSNEGSRSLAFKIFSIVRSRNVYAAYRRKVKTSQSLRPKLLVIDDDPQPHWVLKEGLSDEFEILEAYNGRKGLVMATKHMPDIILLDIVMRGRDGLSVLKSLKRKGNPAEVVMLSGYGDTKFVVSAIQSGAVDFINKPFDVGEVSLRLWSVYRAAFLRRYVRSR